MLQQPAAAAGRCRAGAGADFGGGRYFEGVGDVAASAEAASLRVHHSFVELPDAGFRPRFDDPRAGYIAIGYQGRSARLEEPLARRLILRHRLEKTDPQAKLSAVKKPIVYYLDPGTPEPIRSALLEGARWWSQAFEAAGFKDAFRVELRPADVNPLDARYNVINWVHRSTRGWSTGGAAYDPRTGEIIKGVVTLGSLRVRQDYLIAEGLLTPYAKGDENPPQLAEWALARLKQLSAHEVGHTLGLSHNYYDSDLGRISVMDYPHRLVTLKGDGTLDVSSVYARGIGEWDKAAIAWGYLQAAPGADEGKALAAILDEAWKRDVRFLTNQDIETHPRADWWSNGTDAAAELVRMLEVRRAALRRFGENAIRAGRPMATIEETLVPLYLHHRYQVEAAASVLGGQHYIYALRGDGRKPTRPASAAEQKAALDALLLTLAPAELRLPDSVLAAIPPRPSGYPPHRELFPRYTGAVFDAVSPAVVAADHTVRAARPERGAGGRRRSTVPPGSTTCWTGWWRPPQAARRSATRRRSRAVGRVVAAADGPESERPHAAGARARDGRARAARSDGGHGCCAPRRRARAAAADIGASSRARRRPPRCRRPRRSRPPADRRAGSDHLGLEPFCSLAGGLWPAFREAPDPSATLDRERN